MAFRYSGAGWRVAAAIRTFGDQIMGLRGHTLSYTVDGTLGDVDHSNRVSDHNPDPSGIVRALDFYEHRIGFVDEIGEALRLGRDPRVKYFIHDRRMFASYNSTNGPPWTWRVYTGPNGHTTHGHLSVTTLGDSDASPFALGQQEEDMPLTSDDIRRIWEYPVPDEDDGLGTRGAVHALRQAWGYALRASVDAAVARRLAEQAASGTTLTPAQIDAIADAVAAEVADDVADEFWQRLQD